MHFTYKEVLWKESFPIEFCFFNRWVFHLTFFVFWTKGKNYQHKIIIKTTTSKTTNQNLKKKVKYGYFQKPTKKFRILTHVILMTIRQLDKIVKLDWHTTQKNGGRIKKNPDLVKKFLDWDTEDCIHITTLFNWILDITF